MSPKPPTLPRSSTPRRLSRLLSLLLLPQSPHRSPMFQQTVPRTSFPLVLLEYQGNERLRNHDSGRRPKPSRASGLQRWRRGTGVPLQQVDTWTPSLIGGSSAAPELPRQQQKDQNLPIAPIFGAFEKQRFTGERGLSDRGEYKRRGESIRIDSGQLNCNQFTM